MSADPYATPESDLVVEVSVAHKVLSEQSLFGAIFGGVIGAFVGAGLWVFAAVFSDGGNIMMAVIGITTGFFVRFVGRGVEIKYRVIAGLFAFAGSISCALFIGMPVINVFFLLLSVGLAAAFACRSLDGEQTHALWRVKHRFEK